MKNLKISETAHKELKVFSATVGYDMSVIASDAILQYVKAQKKIKKQTNKQKQVL